MILNVTKNESVNLSQKLNNHLGKIGLLIMVTGMLILYYDGIRLIPIVPIGYQFYEHPEIHIPIISMIMAFVGLGIFIYNFRKGEKVI